MTRGIIPRSTSSTPKVNSVPIVNVLPLPVYPYASTVALKPAKQPSTKFFTQASKTASCGWLKSKALSNVKLRSFPMVTVFSYWTSKQIFEFSWTSLGLRGLTLSATLTDTAAWLEITSAKKPSGFGCIIYSVYIVNSKNLQLFCNDWSLLGSSLILIRVIQI